MTDLEVRDGGWLVPVAVIHKHFEQWQREAVEHIDAAMPFVKHRRLAIQAGGNLGIWPRMLIEDYGFQKVVTFEPDVVNLQCLAHNTGSMMDAVTIYGSALGAKEGKARWARASEHKPGWHKIAPDHCATKFVAGEVSVVPIDTFGLDEVDFLALDVEGYELEALMGAEQTVARCRPVVLIEDLYRSKFEGFRKRKSGVAYGHEPGAAQAWLQERGYAKVSEVKNDEIWAAQ